MTQSWKMKENDDYIMSMRNYTMEYSIVYDMYRLQRAMTRESDCIHREDDHTIHQSTSP